MSLKVLRHFVMKTKNFMEYFKQEVLKNFKNFHEIFKYFKVKYFIVLPISNDHFIEKFPRECACARIFEIGRYLAKVASKTLWLTFLIHGVEKIIKVQLTAKQILCKINLTERRIKEMRNNKYDSITAGAVLALAR